MPYVGRFAPSPTGPLHFGSLLAAVASYLDARAHGGRWLLRMEDIDPPREVAGAADDILRALERYGFEWDGEVVFQSRRSEAYRDALERLIGSGHAYPCRCSRREVAAAATALGLPPHVYPGSCRVAGHAVTDGRAIRVMVPPGEVAFVDAIQGPQRQSLANEVGDFVVRRADGLWAYQLAVVVDDAAQGISHIVRGSDLLDSTPRQIHLQRVLGLATPHYLHIPVATDAHGDKLSKQTYAPPLAQNRPVPSLWRALDFLGQRPPPELREGELGAAWRWAVAHWHRDAVPRKLAIPLLDERPTT